MISLRETIEEQIVEHEAMIKNLEDCANSDQGIKNDCHISYLVEDFSQLMFYYEMLDALEGIRRLERAYNESYDNREHASYNFVRQWEKENLIGE